MRRIWARLPGGLRLAGGGEARPVKAGRVMLPPDKADFVP